VGQSVCLRCGTSGHLRGAHSCPHGRACRHRQDFETPECVDCCPAEKQRVPLFSQKYFGEPPGKP
jgi:hypothetical protein